VILSALIAAAVKNIPDDVWKKCLKTAEEKNNSGLKKDGIIHYLL
jgi:hypothetical protein